jgi:hypothetical protein
MGMGCNGSKTLQDGEPKQLTEKPSDIDESKDDQVTEMKPLEGIFNLF